MYIFHHLVWGDGCFVEKPILDVSHWVLVFGAKILKYKL